MTEPDLPRVTFSQLPALFDDNSILQIYEREPYERFLRGEALPLRYTVFDYEGEDDLPNIKEGVCVAILHDHFSFETQWRDGDYFPAIEPDQYVQRLLKGLWLAECGHGAIRRQAHDPLKLVLESYRHSIEPKVPVVPMKSLEQTMCRREQSRDQAIQYPGAFKTLYETGSFSGLMTRSWCHLGCLGVDVVWIEDDLCLFWMRSDAGPNADWIRLFPFRLDRSGESGRLLRAFCPKRFWLRNVFLPDRLRRPPVKMYWHDV